VNDQFTVPELTLGLRNFASPRSLGDVHARYFAPLLDARRAAAIAARWSGRVTAFDAERLESTMRLTLAELATERFPKSAPDRRALTAQLEDACGDLFDALADLGESQGAVLANTQSAPSPEHWTNWVTHLREVFSAADRGWEQMQPLLALAPSPSGRSGRTARGGPGR
jgi:hypothetical protein